MSVSLPLLGTFGQYIPHRGEHANSAHDHDQSFTKTALSHGGITDITDIDESSDDLAGTGGAAKA